MMRLIKNCIICWNYLYLSQKLEEIEDAVTRQVFLDAVAHGSVISWQHINLCARRRENPVNLPV